jgi:hypothetical protein
VTARIDAIDLLQRRNQQLALLVRATMIQTWQAAGEEPMQSTCGYRYTSEEQAVSAWLPDDGAPLREAVAQAIQSFARWMSRDLEAFAARSELPETATEPASCYRAPRS